MSQVLDIRGLDKSYGNERVLEDLDLTVEKGDFICLLGRSGSGKSTLLNCIAGLEDHDGGAIDGEWESMGYVFQEDRLLNWKTVRENIELILQTKGVPEEVHDERVHKYLDMVGLSSNANDYPLPLSGGMRQRVSIARALAIEPDVLLMDEPFSSLDEITARELRESFLEIITELDQTVVFVTHNATEAAFLSTKIVVLGATSPTEIAAEIENPLPYPRDIDSPEILEFQKEIVDQI